LEKPIKTNIFIHSKQGKNTYVPNHRTSK